MSNQRQDIIKTFGMTNQLIVEDLIGIEKKFDLDLGHVVPSKVEESDYYPQFEQSVRCEAAQMARYFEVIYCLEKSIRKLISDTLSDAEGDDWWNTKRIPVNIRDEVKKRIAKEVDCGMTRRSDDELDYTTFGELAVLMPANWDLFRGTFTSQKAVEKVMTNLNSLRAPIAHCSKLAEDEVLRLQLTVRDWFRLME